MGFCFSIFLQSCSERKVRAEKKYSVILNDSNESRVVSCNFNEVENSSARAKDSKEKLCVWQLTFNSVNEAFDYS